MKRNAIIVDEKPLTDQTHEPLHGHLMVPYTLTRVCHVCSVLWQTTQQTSSHIHVYFSYCYWAGLKSVINGWYIM